MESERARVEGFLSLEQAAEQLRSPVADLSRQIEEGRVVAIVKEGQSWLSAGEVSRLRRQSERAASVIEPEPPEEIRLLHRSTAEPPRRKIEIAPLKTALPADEPEALFPETSPAEPPQSVTEPPQPAVVPPEPAVSAPSSPAKMTEAAKSGAVVPAPEAPSNSRPPALPVPSAPPTPSAAPAPSAIEEKLAQQVRELNRRCAELETRNNELEATGNRLKSGLQETEATLKRNRTARANLENDVIGLQEQLGKSRARSEALEREVQHLGSELERIEDTHNSELRRMRSAKSERVPEDRDASASTSTSSQEFEELRAQMAEKDRLLGQEYEQRAVLRSQLEDTQQKYYELKARYDKEKSEWSELLAQALQNQGQLREQIEEMRVRANPKGWNPFRREK